MKNLYQKINDIQKEVTSVHKGSTVNITQNSSYKAVSHDDVASLLHLPMANAGICVEVDMVDCKIDQIITEKTYNGSTDKKYSYQATVTMLVTFVNADDPKERFSVRSTAYAFDSGDKAVGKAESMAVKYVYLKNFNLESTDDEESRDYQIRDNYNSPPPKEYQDKEPPRGTSLKGNPASEKQRALVKKLYPNMDVSNLAMSDANKLIQDFNNKGK